MSAPEPDVWPEGWMPDTCRSERVKADWIAADRLYRAGQLEAMASVLCPDGMTRREAWTRAQMLLIGGAGIVGQHLRESSRRTRPEAEAGELFFGLELVANDGTPLDHAAAPQAVFVAQLITAAANQDLDQVIALAAAWLPPDAPQERADALVELMRVGVMVGDAVAAGPHAGTHHGYHLAEIITQPPGLPGGPQ